MEGKQCYIYTKEDDDIECAKKKSGGWEGAHTRVPPPTPGPR